MRDKGEMMQSGVDYIEQLAHNADDSAESSHERHGKKYSTRRTIGATVLTACLVGGVMAGSAAVLYGYGYAQALAPHVEAKGSIVKGGKGTIEKISMEMPPITLSTAETKVTGEKVAFEEDFEALGLSVPMNQQTVTRDATVETLITLDPGKVEVSYDSAKDKLIYTIPDNDKTLTTKVHIPTGKSKTSDTSGSLTSLPGAVMTDITNSISGTFGNDASSVPILNGVAKGTTSVSNALESFGDLAITTGVDQECTPKIEKIPHFTDKLKDNFKTVMGGQVMASEDLPALMDKPLKDVRKIIDKATVEMPTNYKIGPDQEELGTFNKYLKSKLFSMADKNVPPITCGVSKSAKLSLVDAKDDK